MLRTWKLMAEPAVVPFAVSAPSVELAERANASTC